MGLDVSHGCWSGAYSAFARFRMELARAAGIPLPLMEGWWGESALMPVSFGAFRDKDEPTPLDKAMAWSAPKVSAQERPGVFTRASVLGAMADMQSRPMEVNVLHDALEQVLPWLPISWEPWEGDPLVDFLNHSDCDGEISGVPYQRALAMRLEGLLPKLPEPGWPGGWGHLKDMRAATQKWIDGLRAAADEGEPVRFY